MAAIRDFTILAILFLAEFSRGAFFLTFLPLYTAEYLGWTLAIAGLATSAHYLTETLFKSFAGWQLDRFGRPVLTAGLLMCLATLVAVRIYPYPVLLIISSALFGMGYSPLWIGVITKVAPANGKNRSSRISMVFIAWLAGMGCGLTMVSFFISAGYDTAFLVITGFLLAAVIIALVFYPPAETGRLSAITPPDPLLRSIRRLISNKAVSRVLLPGMFIQTLSVSLLLPVLPIFARTRLDLSHDEYGLLVLAGGVAAVLFLIPMGRLAEKISLKALLFTGFACTSAALAGLAVAANRQNAIVITLILGISFAAVLPAWNTLLARAIPPEGEGTGWGVFSTIEGLSIAAGPALGGLLARYCDPVAALLAAAGMLSAMALFYLFYPIERFSSQTE